MAAAEETVRGEEKGFNFNPKSWYFTGGGGGVNGRKNRAHRTPIATAAFRIHPVFSPGCVNTPVIYGDHFRGISRKPYTNSHTQTLGAHIYFVHIYECINLRNLFPARLSLSSFGYNMCARYAFSYCIHTHTRACSYNYMYTYISTWFTYSFITKL